MIFNSLFWQAPFPLIKKSCKKGENDYYSFFLWFLWINCYLVLSKEKAPNQADNMAIFKSCLQPKMRLPVVLEGWYTGYKPMLASN